MPQEKHLKSTTNRSYLFGDFDKDKIPNADDKYPFDKNKSEPTQEVSLTDELRAIKKSNQKYRHPAEKIANKFSSHKVMFRVKGTYSTIGKLRRNYLNQVLDIGAVKVIGKNQEDLKNLARRIKSEFKVIKERNYYPNSPKGHEYYKAIHLTVMLENKPIEIQLKTEGHHRLHLETHPIYKTYQSLSPRLKRKLISKAKEITGREG